MSETACYGIVPALFLRILVYQRLGLWIAEFFCLIEVGQSGLFVAFAYLGQSEQEVRPNNEARMMMR